MDAAGTALTLLGFSLAAGRFFEKLPRTKQRLDGLRDRCLELLNKLNELSESLELDTVAGFIDEMETILHEIMEKLESWRSLNLLYALLRQGNIQDWIESQNKRIDDALAMMNTQLLVSHTVQPDDNRARQECNFDGIWNHLTARYMEPNRTNLQHPQVLQIPRTAPDTCFHDPSSSALASSASHGVSHEPLLFRNERNGSISSANFIGLVDYLLATAEDEQFKQIFLNTYEDYATPEEFFELVRQRFLPAHYPKRHEIVQTIVIWLQDVPSGSELLRVVQDFATAAENNLALRHLDKILQAVDIRSRGPIISPPSYEEVEPSNLDDIAVALSFMEAEARATVRWIDYLRYDRLGELSSSLGALFSLNDKMRRWVKFSTLRYDEIEDRAAAIERFVKTAEACLELHNYNSAAVIAAVLLDWKSKPMTDIPRTMDALKKTTQASMKQLAKLINPHRNYEAYRKILKSDTDHIPWLVAHLDDVKRTLSRYPRTIEVDNVQLINFERYQHLALKVKVPGYRVPLYLEGDRRKKYIEYFRHQIDVVELDEEAECRRLRELKRREDKDYWSWKIELRSLGFW
ncbi:Serine/threonine-protein kinase STY17 [Mycena sanguinolenta]|uniref:Serine/threonine-protein kinase STY17 n=1 Tax=Mycena sanguinolenta TaxID=230812 RepID=A0A8H6XE05_9AGAR|nr:Serine/threonine-protein kinase STY17 [Mycena sanguinolenta]